MPAAATVETREFNSGLQRDFRIAALSRLVPAKLPQIGQYQLVQQIGKGGMGVVYRAQHLRLKRWVALKLLSDRRLIDAHSVARFEREMEIVGRLDHPNIVRATDAGYADGYHYLAMELIDGFNLAQIVREQGELSVPDVCEMVRQTAVGLNHAYEHGLIHRDIKPNNLMLSTRGVVKVLDLGLARLSRTEEGEALTGTGTVMGTPDYMAPEQWDASKDVDHRADVYSLGCTLHTLLAKRPPFSGTGLDSASRKMAAHLQAQPPRMEDSRSDVPVGVQAVIDRAMAKDPDERFQRPMEIAEALTEFAREADLAALAQLTMSVVRVAIDPAVNRDPDPATTAKYALRPIAETVGPTRVVPGAARRTRVRLGVAVGVLGLAAASAAFFSTRWGTEEQHNLPGPQPTADLKPKPNEWFDLLAAEPTKAVWPQGKADTDSAWKYDGPNRELWVHAVERAMVKLAEIEDVDFALECTISQHPWRGNIGVYFADRAWGAHHRADLVALDGFDFTRAETTIPLIRGRIDHANTKFAGSIYDRTVGVPNPTTPACKLWLAAYRTGEILVQWDGQPKAVTLRPRDDGTARGTAGAIGVYVEDSTAVFRLARLRILSPNP